MSLHGAKFNWNCDKCDYSVRYAATLVKHRALHLINPNFKANENADASLLLGLAEGDAEVSADAIADVVIPSNIKLKLNLKQISSSNGSAVTTGEEQPIESAESSSVGGDEELKSDDGEMVIEEEDDLQEDLDSIVDGSPDLVAHHIEDEVDDEEEVDAVVDSDSLQVNNIAIETK